MKSSARAAELALFFIKLKLVGLLPSAVAVSVTAAQPVLTDVKPKVEPSHVAPDSDVTVPSPSSVNN